jgi:hypothetical protein
MKDKNQMAILIYLQSGIDKINRPFMMKIVNNISIEGMSLTGHDDT